MCVILMLFRGSTPSEYGFLPFFAAPNAMCEDCMGRLAASEGQTLTRSRRRVVIRCPLRCDALTERVLA